jgi:hypothetical protein
MKRIRADLEQDLKLAEGALKKQRVLVDSLVDNVSRR